MSLRKLASQVKRAEKLRALTPKPSPPQPRVSLTEVQDYCTLAWNALQRLRERQDLPQATRERADEVSRDFNDLLTMHEFFLDSRTRPGQYARERYEGGAQESQGNGLLYLWRLSWLMVASVYCNSFMLAIVGALVLTFEPRKVK